MLTESTLYPIVIKFCHIYSLTISIMQIPLFIIIILLLNINKNRSAMRAFSIQLTIAAICNVSSYFLPYYKPEENDITLICRLQALLHILSFIMTINMLCIYYLLNVLMFVNPILLTSNAFYVLIYLAHWLATLLLGGFNYLGKPIAGKLNVCRYDTHDTMPFVNTIYSFIILFLTLVFFLIIQIKVCKRMKDSLTKKEAQSYKNVIHYFIIVIIIVLIKFLSYFLKEHQKAMNVFYLIDRVWENLTSLLLIITLVIGKKGFVDLWELIIGCKNKLCLSTDAQINGLNKVTSLTQSSIES